MEFKHFQAPFLFVIIYLIICCPPLYAQEKVSKKGPKEKENKVHFGGYGELHYNNMLFNAEGETTSGKLDMHRFALFFGYDFNDWISFHSELELEHSLIAVEDGHTIGGEIALKKAYIDLGFMKEFGARVGIMRVPVGIVNVKDEPPLFNSVERPNVETYLIPSTWSESGIGFFGTFKSGISYQAYLMAGLAPNKINGETGIREARQNAFRSSTANIAIAGRLDYQVNPYIKAGLSYFYSSLNHGIEEGRAEKIPALNGVHLNLIDGHLIYQKGRFETRLLAVYSTLSRVEALNQTFKENVGKNQLGGYIELAYDLLPFFSKQTAQHLMIFGRYGNYDTQNETLQITDNPEFHREDYTFGLTYKPVHQVVFKADYQILTSAGEKNIGQLNLGVGYEF